MKKIHNHKKFFYLLLIFSTIAISTQAQDQSVKDLQAASNKKVTDLKVDSGKTWKTGGIFNLNLGQGSQSNWAAGGDDFSFSAASYLGFYALYKKARYSWDNTLDFNYGLVNTTSQGTRKNDDRLDLLSKVGYELRQAKPCCLVEFSFAIFQRI